MSAAVITPASWKSASRPLAIRGEPADRSDRPLRRPRSRHRAACPVSSRSDSSVTSAAGGLPGEDSARLAVDDGVDGAAHAPQVQVEHSAEVQLRRIAALAPAQIAMQRDRIQQRLQRIVRARASLRPAARGCSRRPSAVRSRGGAAEPVRLVVHDDVAVGGLPGRIPTRRIASRLPFRNRAAADRVAAARPADRCRRPADRPRFAAEMAAEHGRQRAEGQLARRADHRPQSGSSNASSVSRSRAAKSRSRRPSAAGPSGDS